MIPLVAEGVFACGGRLKGRVFGLVCVCHGADWLRCTQIKDLVLDNTGNFIYKALPFAIALLHLPFFKPVTEGMPAFE